MAYTLPPEIEKRVEEQMAIGGYASQREVLLEALRALEERNREEVDNDDWPAIKEALDEMDAGDPGRPAEEVFDELRKQYGL